MTLVPPQRPTGLDVDAATGGGRHRADLPRHDGPRRLGGGAIAGIVAGALVVVLLLAGGGWLAWQQGRRIAAVQAYSAARDAYDAAIAARDADGRAADDTTATIAAAKADVPGILAAATDGTVDADAKQALAAALAGLDDVPAPASGEAATVPDDALYTDEQLDAVGPFDAAAIDRLRAASDELTSTTATLTDAGAAAAAALAAAQQRLGAVDDATQALVDSAVSTGQGWLDAFPGKDAGSGKLLSGALDALRDPSLQTAEVAAALEAYETWAAPARPGALDDPASIYVVVDKLRPVGDPDETDPGARSWAPAPDDLVAVGNGQRVRSVAATALKALQAGAQAAGFRVPAQSCYRSYGTQLAVYNSFKAAEGAAMADSHSARPGYSEHQTGLVCDIGVVSQSWGTTGAGKWTAAHAAEYGFILRYDDGKQDESGYVYEPWHFRYVGVDTAKAIVAAGNPTLEAWFGLPAPKTYSDGSGSPDEAPFAG